MDYYDSNSPYDPIVPKYFKNRFLLKYPMKVFIANSATIKSYYVAN